MVLGDDTIALIPPLDAYGEEIDTSRIIAAVGAWGFTIPEVVASFDPARCDFLACRPLRCEEDGVLTYAWVPTLGRRLYKHHCMLKDGHAYAWLRGVVQAELLVYGWVPILGHLNGHANRILKSGPTTPYESTSYYDIGNCPGNRVACEHTYIDIMQVYGITKCEVEELNDLLSGIHTLPAYVSTSLFEKLWLKDI